MNSNFDETIALVTGASRGLGRAVAERLGSTGAQVIAVARTVGGLEELDDAIRAAGGKAAVLVPLDITDGEGLDRLGAAVNQRWGRLDVWIHAAVHAGMLTPVEHIEPDEMERSLAINVAATQRLIRVIDPLLRQSAAGRAILIDDALAADAFNGAYLADKQSQRELFAAWGRGLSRTSPARSIRAVAPPMPTALRGRWFPGEDRAALTRPETVAGRLVEAIARTPSEDLDLRT